MRDAIERAFFAPTGSGESPAAGASGEAGRMEDRELLSSWIEAHREDAVAVDVDLCAGAAHAAKLAAECAADILAGSPRVIRV